VGLARTFQTASIFPEFTVREQITLGCDVTLKRNPLITAFSLGKVTDEELLRDKKVEQILELTGLSEISEQTVGTISAAAQRFTMIATALASSPDLLLLDEPAAGLVSQERDDLANLIRSIRNQGVSVLVIEHHMSLIMDVCDRIVVLNFGSKIAEGTPAEIKNNKAVIDAYLGETA
jgi:branched-chain amino acid transport system ATP-binding protein